MDQLSYFYGYVFAFGFSALSCLWAAWRIREVAYSETRQSLFAFFFGSSLWSACYLGFLLSTPALLKHLFYQGSLWVGFATVFAWLWFCSVYSGRGLHRDRRVRWFGLLTYLLVTGLKAANPLHGMYYQLEPTGTAFGLVVTHGALYWVVMALAYALAAGGYVLLFEVFLKTDGPVAPLAALTGVTALPAAFNVIGHLDKTFLDVTHEPIGVAVFAVGVSFSYTYHFSAVRIANQADRPTLMIRPTGEVRGLGGGAAKEVPEISRDLINETLEEKLPSLHQALERSRGESTGVVWESRSNEGQKFYLVSETRLNGSDSDRAVVLSDITGRERRKRKLERKNDLFQKAQDLANVGAWEYQIGSNELTWSKEVYKIYGFSEEEPVTLEKALQPYPEEDRLKLRGALGEAISQGRSFDHELRLERQDGSVRWVRVYGEPQAGKRQDGEPKPGESETERFRLKKGGQSTAGVPQEPNAQPVPKRIGAQSNVPRRIRGAFKDITERKKRQRRSEKLRKKYKTLLEGAPDAIFIADRETGRIEEVNQEATKLMKTTREDILGERQISLHPPEEADRYRRLFERKSRESQQDGTPETVSRFEDGSPVCVKTSEGEKIPVEIRSTTLQLEGRTYTAGIFRDVTESRKRERELERAKSEAEEASRMKSAMLANMSHEIRTPLTSIIGFSKAIGDEIEEDGQVSRFADLIGKSGNRLLGTLDAVLNLSKLEAGKMQIESRPVDLGKEAKIVAQELRPDAEEKGIDLRVKTSSTRAKADQGAVQIVFQNLISNAIKYTGEGGDVEVRVREENGEAVLEVIDTGIGMDPETVEQLLEPFRQESEGFSREYEGTGIGLAVTKKATEQMEGAIDVRTEKGEGSRFTVSLPLAEKTPTVRHLMSKMLSMRSLILRSLILKSLTLKGLQQAKRREIQRRGERLLRAADRKLCHRFQEKVSCTSPHCKPLM